LDILCSQNALPEKFCAVIYLLAWKKFPVDDAMSLAMAVDYGRHQLMASERYFKLQKRSVG
jgi:hypothetical protein